MKRRLLSLFVAFAMTISMVVVGAGAVEPTYGDTAGHWAESAIDRWSGHGIIHGSNGEFDPNGPLTCAQLATILAKLLKLPAATDAGFHDNAAGAWYYDAINRCAAAGILNGNGDGTVDPNGAISRERAMVMLGRALGIKPLENPDLTKFSDAAKVASYAQGMVAALIEKGIVGGVTSDTLAPQDDINRASTVTILDRAISIYADKDGATIDAKGAKLVLIVAKNVKVTNAPEGALIIVADGVTGTTVNGKAVAAGEVCAVPAASASSGGSSSGGSSGGGNTPTTGGGNTPTTGGGNTPTTGGGNTPTTGGGNTPTTGGGNTPTTGGGNTPTTGGGNTPTTGGGNTPTTGGGNTPTTGGGNTPTTGGGNTPTTGSGNTPTTGSGNTPTTGSGAANNAGGNAMTGE